MDSMENTFTISLPDWIEGYLSSLPAVFAADEDRMAVAVTLSKLNVTRGTGGPFGAAIFDLDSQALVAVGVNRVVPCDCSMAHAEMVAIALAQKTLGTFDLSAAGNYQLATSCAPCAMCLGAIAWSGMRSILCAAREEDARTAGFDEGDKPENWTGKLAARNIHVTQDVLRDEAKQILADYKTTGGPIYNPRS
jgi:tRNA(Arg) A34 adenosine deaminase TadA